MTFEIDLDDNDLRASPKGWQDAIAYVRREAKQ